MTSDEKSPFTVEPATLRAEVMDDGLAGFVPNLANALYYLWRRNNWMLDPRFYVANYRDVQIHKPIFLVGVQGGGLTLVSRMLRRTESVVAVSGKNHWAGADEMHTVFGPVLVPELSGTDFKVPLPDHSRFPSPRSWTYGSDELLPYYRLTDQDANLEAEQNLKQIIGYLLTRYTREPGEARFIDKSQVNSLRIDFIRELLRESSPRFLHVVMNPYVLCYKSAKGRAGDMEQMKSFTTLKERLDICAQHWRNLTEAALKDGGDDMITIRFEDLLSDPQRTMSRVFDFLDLEFLPARNLPQEDHEMPFGSRFSDRWYPLRENRPQRWIQRMQDDLGEEGEEIIRIQCGELAGKFGYSI